MTRHTPQAERRAAATPARHHRTERGAATAEYAAVTACGVGFGGILLQFLTSAQGQGIIDAVFGKALGFLGL